ncbi:ATP-binding cassette sub-family C member 9-like isoform X1 [Bolinopsis microptera]|uniref:ATP-binding cassette sub-family C member 9-like isoform X1 n=1 Tax=Bolinopsis microptera TaxID=2820187 RepID=UPI00307AEAD8
MLKFCEFPNINGLVSLCTGELVSVVSNIYLVVLTFTAIILVRTQKKCNNRKWSCHTLIWVLMILNCISILLYSTAWLIIAKTEAIVVYQVLNILAFLCLPLSFNIFEQRFHPKFNIALTAYCLLSGISKMLIVTSFSRSLVTWSWVSGVDVRFVCAVVQATVLLFLTFITFYNFWMHLRNDFSEIPSDDTTRRPLRSLSRALYLWCWELLVKARSKTLQLSDCFLLPDEDCADFEKTASSLFMLVLKEHAKQLLLSGMMYLVSLALEFVPIYITFCILSNFASPNITDTNQALFSIKDVSHNNYCLIVLLFISETVKCVLHQSHSFMAAEMAAKTQKSVQGLLYSKLVRVAQWELNDGLVDVVTLQVDHVTTGLQMIHNVWKIPLQFTLCLIFMEMLIGLSALLPIVVLILCLLFTSWLLHKRSFLESKLQASKQSWYYLVQEFIEHIWILKIRNIHTLFKKKILEETSKIPERKVTVLFALIQIVKHGLPSLLLILMFLLFYLVDGDRPLTVPAGVGAVLLLNMVRIQLSTAQTFCKQILLMAEALADISNTLAKDEIELPNSNIYQDVELVGEASTSAQEEETVAKISNGTFTWGTERMSPKVLSDVNIKIPKGKLTIIVGRPGSGKTSLLSALLCEMHNMVGEVIWAPDTKVAVAAQQPVIFGGTVKENVLFGKVYDVERYLKIITLCNLKEHTLNYRYFQIQESKSNSYHPISLARALYSSSPVLILDNPLAGLDTQSREQFFFESVVLFAAEENRTVVMTTDNPELVEHAHQVILLDQGKVMYDGSPAELNRDCDSFLDLLASHNKTLPPPLPVRRRLEKGRVTEPADEINIKSIPNTTYKEWIQSCNTVKLTMLLISLFFTTFLNAITYWLLLRWIASYTPTSVVLVPENENIAYITNDVTPSSNTSSASPGEAVQFFIAGGGLSAGGDNNGNTSERSSGVRLLHTTTRYVTLGSHHVTLPLQQDFPSFCSRQVYSGFGADRSSSDGLPGSCPVSSSTDIRGTHCTGDSQPGSNSGDIPHESGDSTVLRVLQAVLPCY